MNLGDRLLAAAFHRNRWELLGAGMLLHVFARGWPGIDVLAWFAPIPWLHFLRHNPQPRQRLHFGLAWLLAWAVAFTTSPATGAEPGATAMLATATLVALLVWERTARCLAPNEGLLAFGLLMAAASAAATSLSGGAAAMTLAATGIAPLERLVGVIGSPALTFVVHWTAATIEGQWETVYPSSMQHHASALIVVLLSLLVVGATSDGQPTVFSQAGSVASANAIGIGFLLLLLIELQRRQAWRQARSQAPAAPW